MLLAALCLPVVHGRAQTNAVHTMTFVNEGGGYFSFNRSTPDGQSVDTTYSHYRWSTRTLQVPEGSSVYIGLSSERRGSFFYSEIRYDGGFPRLLHFYVDNREVPLDSIYSFYDEEGLYHWYSYTLDNITSDHTFRAVFGEWEEDINPSPLPTHTVTFIKQGNGSMYGGCSHSDGSSGSMSLYDRDTLRLTAEEGLHFSVSIEDIRPDSWYWNWYSGQQPLHLYVDDVEIPLDSLSRRFDCYTLEYYYYYRQIVTSDHVVRVVFGPVDTTQLPPLHTIEVVNEGGGYIDYGALSSFFDNQYFHNMPDTLPFQAEEGMSVNIEMRSLRPGHWRFEESSRIVSPRLLHFYVDGVEIPLDSIYVGYYRDEYMYVYTLSDITSSHSIRAVFGQWDSLPSIHVMTIQNQGGGKIHSPRLKVHDAIRMLQVSEGDPFTVKLDSYRPGSSHYGEYANPKLLHFYVDDVEVPLGSMYSGYDAASGALQYAYTVAHVSANHTFRAEFGPWSDDEYVLSLDVNDAAMGSVAGGGLYRMGETATLTVTANEGYCFVGWHDGNTDNPRSIIVVSDTLLTAHFAENVGIGDVDTGQLHQPAIYPNPASDRITLSKVEPGAKISIVNINGREVLSLTSDRRTATADISPLATGVYFVRIVGEHQSAVRKLIVK